MGKFVAFCFIVFGFFLLKSPKCAHLLIQFGMFEKDLICAGLLYLAFFSFVCTVVKDQIMKCVKVDWLIVLQRK